MCEPQNKNIEHLHEGHNRTFTVSVDPAEKMNATEAVLPLLKLYAPRNILLVFSSINNSESKTRVRPYLKGAIYLELLCLRISLQSKESTDVILGRVRILWKKEYFKEYVIIWLPLGLPKRQVSQQVWKMHMWVHCGKRKHFSYSWLLSFKIIQKSLDNYFAHSCKSIVWETEAISQ